MAPARLEHDPQVACFAARLSGRIGKQEITPGTAGTYVADVAQLSDWLARQGLALTTATGGELAAYLEYLAGRYRGATVQRKWSSIKAFYGWAAAEEVIARDPTANLHPVAGSSRPQPRIKGIDKGEAHRLVRATGETAKGVRDRTILLLMAVQGLSVGEAAGLDLADVDLEAGTLRVTGKRGRDRTVWLIAETQAQLRRWLRVRSLLKPPCSALFVSLHWSAGRAAPGNRLSCRGMRMMVDGYLRQVGAKRPGVSCQALRRLYASLALDAGAELGAVAQSLGHANTATTLRYRPEDKERDSKNPARLVAELL